MEGDVCVYAVGGSPVTLAQRRHADVIGGFVWHSGLILSDFLQVGGWGE